MEPKAKRASQSDDILKELRAFGLAYPGTHYKSPWPGHLDLAVKDKTFAYLSLESEPLRVSCKLPASSAMALMLPFAKPAGYGLGKSGWVDARFVDGDHVPIDMLKAWIDESYRAQAPKKLVASLTTHAAAPAKRARAATKPTKPTKPTKRTKPKSKSKSKSKPKPRPRRAKR